MNSNISELKESDFLKILWDYFCIHGAQRIQILNFYIILETFFITALLTLFQLEGSLSFLKFILSFAIIFFSFIFYVLDYRTKKMIKLSENAIKNIEQKYEDIYGENIMIFSIEEKITKSERKSKWFARHFLSYSKSFKMIFLFFVIVGFFSIIIEICNILL